ncbi:MAG TPA: energy transducer TonB [Edaphobacter sp.]|jgi:hypothetical protein
MSNFIRFCVLALISGWIIPATILAAPSAAFPQQATPSPAADPDKQTSAPAKPRQPRPNPDAEGKYHIGDGVTAPFLFHSEELSIPKNMRKAIFSGRCLVALTVDIKGDPEDVHIVRSTPDPNDKGMHDVANALQNSCIEAAQKYRFRPGTFQGKPVPVDLKLEISYQQF